MLKWLRRLFSLKESAGYPHGRPVNLYDVLPGTGWQPVYVVSRSQEQGRPAALSSLEELDRARLMSRLLLDYNGNAIGLMRGLTSYTLGKGSAVTCQSADPDDEPPKRLTKQVQAVLRQFKAANVWDALEPELYTRLHRDGEFFLRFFPDEDNITNVRVVEPGAVRPPNGRAVKEWSWGILTDEDDTRTVRGYCVHYPDGSGEEVEPHFIVHVKVNTDSTVKRGLPSFFAVQEDLEGAYKLRHASREGEKVRGSIAYIRQHASATQGAIQSLQDASTDFTLQRSDQYGAIKEVKVQQVDVGDVIDIPVGMEFKPPPASPNSPAVAQLLEASLQAASARFNAPVWLASSDSGTTNFAASLTAESPFVKSVEREQGDFGRGVDAILTKVIEIAVEQGVLPDDTLEQIDLQVTFASPVVRNRKEETDRNKTLNEARLLSPQTWSAREDLDYDKEQALLAEAPPLPPGSPLLPTAAPSASPGATYQREVAR